MAALSIMEWLDVVKRNTFGSFREEELKRWIGECLRDYYRYLGEQFYKRRGHEFWSFHRGKLAELDYPLSTVRLAASAIAYLLDVVLNPKRTAEAAARRLLRICRIPRGGRRPILKSPAVALKPGRVRGGSGADLHALRNKFTGRHDMKKILVVRLSGGLCNRLRVLLSAIGYCETTNRNLLIHWTRENHFDVPLRSLFYHPFKEIGRIENLILMKFANKTGKTYEHDQVDFGITGSLIYVDTCSAFCCANEYTSPLISYLSRITPVEPIQNEVIRFYSQYFASKKVLGVSVRYKNAHHKTLQNSPPEWFVQRINEINMIDSTIHFFLSTDCKEISEEIRFKTNALITELPKKYNYNTLDGLQESICDLYLLARTNYILGSYWSSFSDMSFWMRGEMAFETSQDSSNTSLMKRFLRHELPRDFNFDMR